MCINIKMPKVTITNRSERSSMTHDRRRVINKDDKNLNQRVKDVGRRRQSVFIRGGGKFHILFDGPNIKRGINRMINRKETSYVVGCVTHLTNISILKYLSNKKGVCIILTKAKETREAKNQKLYNKLKPAYPGGALRVIGDVGWNTALMAHKFIVGLSETGEPQWVVNGSFDMTEKATSNIENLMILEDEEVAKCYTEEFKRMYSLSKPLKINHII